MPTLRIATILASLALAGCAKATAIPVAANMVRITTDAAQMCGATGAQSVASKQAAIETIRRGYDGYVITAGDHDKTTSFSYNAYGGGSSTQHHQSLLVKMYRTGEPGSENAISAQQQLGPEWRKIASEGQITCLG